MVFRSEANAKRQDGTFHGFLGRLSHLNVEPWSNWARELKEGCEGKMG